MAVESAADRAVFVDPDDFGSVASYVAAGGDPVGIDGLFLNPAARGMGEIASSDPRFVCRSADLPAGAKAGDTLTLDGVVYAVQVIDPDGTGMTVLTIEEAE